MKLQQWIKITGIRQTQLAQLLGASNQRMTRIIKYGLIPHPDEMVKFFWISFGAVRPDDFYDLTAVPAELQHLLDAPKKRRKNYVRIEDIQALDQCQRDRWKRSAFDY
jgi:hypothetical protein